VNTTQAQLGAVLAAGGPELSSLLERTEQRLAEVAQAGGPELAAHVTSTLSAGGKRLRPILVFLCGDGGW
jgi:geranylgeranyl pyrophosphate synthase